MHNLNTKEWIRYEKSNSYKNVLYRYLTISYLCLTLCFSVLVSTTAVPQPQPSTMDVLSSHGKLSSTLRKSLGVKNVDKATLKGLISNVLRDLFQQNFIDPVKGTLKSSLNYTTMLNSVKKVLMKSKDKLFNLKQRVCKYTIYYKNTFICNIASLKCTR